MLAECGPRITGESVRYRCLAFVRLLANRCVWFGLLLTLLLPAVAQATNLGTTPHISLAGNYNFVTTGGTLRASNNATNPCALISGNSGTSVGAGTGNATVSGIPAGSSIVGAYLYFVGDGDTPDYTITFNGTGLTASQQYSDALEFPTGSGIFYKYFGGFVDVTAYVTGNGSYSFGGLSVQNVDDAGGPNYCSNWGVVVGWALVVVYQNASEPLRVINVFDGLQHFYGSSITLNPGNFKIPTSPINGKMAVIVWGGDPDIQGTLNGDSETLQFNGNSLTDALDPANNIYNSTINTLGLSNTWGVDVDTYDVSSYLAAGNTSATTFYSTGQDDNYLTAEVISVTNTPVADLAITKSHSGNFTAGSNGVYTLVIHNNGPNATSGTTTVTDTLPTGFTYVSATGTGWTCGAAGQSVTCTTTSVIANGSNANPITLTVAVGTSAVNPTVNTASVAVDSTIFDNISANNSSSDSTTVLYATDLQITKSHSGNFSAGTQGVYTLTVKNNGPQNIPSGATTTVSDTLPASETYVSATGAGWTCGAAGQLVTCTSTTAMTSGSSLPAITLTVTFSTSPPASVSNTASVSNASVSDTNNTNNGSTDVATVTSPNLSNSTKTVIDQTNNPSKAGDTLKYTITLIESAGQAANNISVTDTLDANLVNFTMVSIPAGSTDNSTPGTGPVNVTGINIPANGSVTIVYTAQIANTAASGTLINNTAAITGGVSSASPSASPIVVTGTTNGNKTLYLLTAGMAAATGTYSRRQGATSTTTFQTLAKGGGSSSWTLDYQAAAAINITGNVVANLYMRTNNSRTYPVQVTLSNGTSTLTGTGNCALNTAATPRLCTINLTGTLPITIAANGQITVTVTNNFGGGGTRDILLYPEYSAATQSTMTFDVNPAINVDSVNIYNTVYPGTGAQSVYEPNQTVYVRVQLSDPFGCFDIGAGTLTLTDPNSTVQVNAANILAANKTTCVTPTAPNAYAASIIYEYPYTLASNAALGNWSASVTAKEGAELTVSNTAANTFLVGVPALLIMKSVSVSTDPVHCTTPGNTGSCTGMATTFKSIPGSVMLYNVLVTNTGNGTAGNIIITDPVPTYSSFMVGSMTFTDGSTSSGLPTPVYSYDNSSCSGSFTYTPTGAIDPNVKCVKAAFSTNMNGKSGASSPYFTVSFKVQIN